MKHFRIALIISVLIISFLIILLTGCKSSYKLTNSNISKAIPLQSQETPKKFEVKNHQNINNKDLLSNNSLGKSIAIGLLMSVTTVAFIAIVRQVNKV